jgi:hypothetical protein
MQQDLTTKDTQEVQGYLCFPYRLRDLRVLRGGPFLSRPPLSARLALVALLLFVCGCGGRGRIASYSAEQVQSDANGRVVRTVRIFAAEGRLRVEQSAPDAKSAIIMIFRRDLGLVRVLIPAEKSYLESPLDEKEIERVLQKPPLQPSAREEVLGTEKVAGLLCVKKRVTATTRFLWRAVRTESTVWVSSRIDIPLRIVHANGAKIEVRELRSGRQSQSLFAVPSGYHKVTNPLEALKAGQAQPGSAASPKQASNR